MAEKTFDLVVVGGGPGGYVAAIRAAQLGLAAALVEAEHLGGICLNWGCIPTKALLRSAELYNAIRNAEQFGLWVKGAGVDLARVVERSRKVAARLNAGVEHLLHKNGVAVFKGRGRLAGKISDRWRVEVASGVRDREQLVAPHVILATGARPRIPPGLEPDGKIVWTYKEAMVPDSMPRSVLVIGSGAIGIEFASFYRNLGAEVTVVELLDRILPSEDEEISALARKAFESQGMKIHTEARITKLERVANGAVATIDGSAKTTVRADRVILAVGIVGNVEDLGLEETRVKVEGAHIVVNEWLETDEPGLYAIGDVVGPPWLAHKASHEGIVCVERIKGLAEVRPLDSGNIPGCIYSLPQVASVGLTEAAARESGREIRVGRFPFRANGKALALGEPEGLIKTVFDAQTGELLGAHMIGAEVTELIQGFVIARGLETTEAELMHTVFPHPTLSEMMHESILDAFGRAIHF